MKKSVKEFARFNANMAELDNIDLDLGNLPNDKMLGDINAFFEKALAE